MSKPVAVLSSTVARCNPGACGHPDEAAELIAFLPSLRAGRISGVTCSIDRWRCLS